jgi:hypothetical protein
MNKHINFSTTGDTSSIEVSAYYDENEGKWLVNDGYNTERYDTEAEAREALEEIADFYDFEIAFNA